jgi:hyaluronoglucosaminidase
LSVLILQRLGACRIDWLFRLSGNLYPSVYFESRLSAKEKVQMIEGRVQEAHRVADHGKTKGRTPKVVPYFWYKYHGGEVFLMKVVPVCESRYLF